VLLKSVLPHKQGCHTDYFTCPGISTSDHKPVAAVLSLPLVTDTVTCRHQHHHRASGPPAGSRGGGAGGDAGAAALLIPGAPNLSISTARAGGTSSSSAKSSFAANWLGRSSRVAAAASSLPFKLFLSQVCLGDAATAQTLTRLVALNADALTNSSTSSQPGTSTPDPSDRIAGSSGLPASGSGRAWDKALNGLMHQGAADTPQQQQQQQQKQRRMKLQLVVSGSCLGGVKGEHVSERVHCLAGTEQLPRLGCVVCGCGALSFAGTRPDSDIHAALLTPSVFPPTGVQGGWRGSALRAVMLLR
jgi:hypothetical protein